MKYFFAAILAITCTQNALANDSNHNLDPPSSHYWRCTAVDGRGAGFTFNLNWSDDRVDFVRRQALAKCRSQSARPNTCRPGSCYVIN